MNALSTHVGLGDSLGHILHAGVRGARNFWKARRNRREVEQLLSFDDAMLRDIGLNRSDVVGALASPRDEDPSCQLVRIRRERRRTRGLVRIG